MEFFISAFKKEVSGVQFHTSDDEVPRICQSQKQAPTLTPLSHQQRQTIVRTRVPQMLTVQQLHLTRTYKLQKGIVAIHHEISEANISFEDEFSLRYLK